MAPELPETFSTTTGCPQASENLWANMRPVTSVALPAVKPTTSRTGFSGQLVWAASGLTAHASKKATEQTDQRMRFLPRRS
jgi:hypothetical protein